METAVQTGQTGQTGQTPRHSEGGAIARTGLLSFICRFADAIDPLPGMAQGFKLTKDLPHRHTITTLSKRLPAYGVVAIYAATLCPLPLVELCLAGVGMFTWYFTAVVLCSVSLRSTWGISIVILVVMHMPIVFVIWFPLYCFLFAPVGFRWFFVGIQFRIDSIRHLFVVVARAVTPGEANEPEPQQLQRKEHAG